MTARRCRLLHDRLYRMNLVRHNDFRLYKKVHVAKTTYIIYLFQLKEVKNVCQFHVE